MYIEYDGDSFHVTCYAVSSGLFTSLQPNTTQHWNLHQHRWENTSLFSVR